MVDLSVELELELLEMCATWTDAEYAGSLTSSAKIILSTVCWSHLILAMVPIKNLVSWKWFRAFICVAVCVAGYNDIVMMWVLSDEEIKDVYKILNGNYDIVHTKEPAQRTGPGMTSFNWKRKGWLFIMFALLFLPHETELSIWYQVQTNSVYVETWATCAFRQK